MSPTVSGWPLVDTVTDTFTDFVNVQRLYDILQSAVLLHRFAPVHSINRFHGQ